MFSKSFIFNVSGASIPGSFTHLTAEKPFLYILIPKYNQIIHFSITESMKMLFQPSNVSDALKILNFFLTRGAQIPVRAPTKQVSDL